MTIELITLLSAVNISLEAVTRFKTNYTGHYPTIQTSRSLEVDLNLYPYAFRALNHEYKHGIIYCLYNQTQYEFQTNMWVANVSSVVWSLVLSTLTLMALISSGKDIVLSKATQVANLTMSLVLCEIFNPRSRNIGFPALFEGIRKFRASWRDLNRLRKVKLKTRISKIF